MEFTALGQIIAVLRNTRRTMTLLQFVYSQHKSTFEFLSCLFCPFSLHLDDCQQGSF